MPTAIVAIALLFFLGHALRWFFIKTKVPDLLILIIIGYIVGPVLQLISPSDFGKVGLFMTTVALIVILYEGGLSLRAKQLTTSALPAALLSVLGFLLVGALTFLLSWTVASWEISLLLALGIGSTSSAVVIPMVKYLDITDDTKTVLSLESAFTDVLAIVLFLVIVDSLTLGTFDIRELLYGIGPKTLISIGMGIFSAMVWAFLVKVRAPFTNVRFSGEAWAGLTFGVIELVHHNGPMGVFALGFMLGNLNVLPKSVRAQFDSVVVDREQLDLLGEVTFLLKTFFFLYLGTLIQFNDVRSVVIASLITVFIFITRCVAVKVLFKPEKTTLIDAITLVAMGPRGLACAVLATIPLQRGIQGGEFIQNTSFAVIPLSIVLTATFVVLSNRPWFRRKAGGLFSKYGEVTS